ncbi:MAG: hypothetical protein WD078_04815 [Woeseia sp.]
MATTLAAALLQGCSGGDGTGLPPDEMPAAIGPVFSEIQSGVFTPTCATAGCHTGAGAPQGLRLDATSSYGLLVNVASSQAPSIPRVAPGDPDGSYLVRKLEGTAAAGARMPLGRPPLAQSTIDVIRQWIIDGALDDRAMSVGDVRVVTLSPMPESTLTSAPAEILAVFDRPLDASTVNVNTFTLTASGGDGTFGDGNEVRVAAAAIGVSGPGTRASFRPAGPPLPTDRYRVRLPGQGPSFVMDLDANALDGEFRGTFPSGNGRQGGDFIADFTIAVPVRARE